MKKITIFLIIIGVIAVSAYVFVREKLRTPGFQPPAAAQPADSTKPSESPLDLRPRVIAKLQELVSQGSEGLYRLNIRSVEPDVLASTVSLKNIRLTPDTAALRRLQAAGRGPADLFSFSLDSLRIEGIGLQDLLKKDVIDLKTLKLLNPRIEIYHQRSETQSAPDSRATLYQRLSAQLRHLSIGRLDVRGGRVTIHQYAKKKATSFGDVEAILTDILMDSTTQNDHKRFFFAREANLSTANIGWRTADGLYDARIAKAALTATSGRLALSGVQLVPRYGKDEFQQHVKTMTNRYSLSIPSLLLHDVDWWRLLNEDRLEASSADLTSADFSVYLDHRKPSGPTRPPSFPHQQLMALNFRIYIPVIRIRNFDVTSEEFSTLSGEAGTLYATGLNGTISNLTNIPERIRRNSHTRIQASGAFMHSIRAKMGLDFDLGHYRNGNFTATLETADADPLVVNPLAGPMGLFNVKKGHIDLLTARITGDNKGAGGPVRFRYTDLHVSALEKNKDGTPGLNKKHITSLLANVAVVKNDNPKNGGNERTATSQFSYDPRTSFFNLIWKATFVGILDIIGAPRRLASP